jgi:hypothetical protein
MDLILVELKSRLFRELPGEAAFVVFAKAAFYGNAYTDAFL